MGLSMDRPNPPGLGHANASRRTTRTRVVVGPPGDEQRGPPPLPICPCRRWPAGRVVAAQEVTPTDRDSLRWGGGVMRAFGHQSVHWGRWVEARANAPLGFAPPHKVGSPARRPLCSCSQQASRAAGSSRRAPSPQSLRHACSDLTLHSPNPSHRSTGTAAPDDGGRQPARRTSPFRAVRASQPPRSKTNVRMCTILIMMRAIDGSIRSFACPRRRPRGLAHDSIHTFDIYRGPRAAWDRKGRASR